MLDWSRLFGRELPLGAGGSREYRIVREVLASHFCLRPINSATTQLQ
jgi:hypothetical protein